MGPYDVALMLFALEPDWRDPNPKRARVSAREHALQCASRALRASASDEEVVIALLHDVARPLSDVNHGEVIAYLLAPRLSSDAFEALFRHGTFQTDIIHGGRSTDQWRSRTWYPMARRLASWDAASFDPDYPTLPLAVFLPALDAVLGSG